MAVRVLSRIDELDPRSWDACAGDSDPFVSHAFLQALETSESACAETGWLPQHLAVEDEDGSIIGCAPLYIKGHSYGEYVFDWSWASASERAGIPYYPKLQACVPFTPITGPRLMVHPRAVGRPIERVLVAAMLELCRRHELSSLHITFLSEREQAIAAELGLLRRSGIQYHFCNKGYRSFDEFLGDLLARKRKAIKKERRRALESGLELKVLRGSDIQSRHLDKFYRFYVSTIDRKWGSPYLTETFFHQLVEALGDRVVLMVANENGEPVAGALNLLGKEALYGRYWGALGRYRFLHFELCYYQAIDVAIELGLARVEAGAQGQHKIQRGYVPVKTYSAHWLAHEGFRDAVAGFLERERVAVDLEIAELRAGSPFQADRAGISVGK